VAELSRRQQDQAETDEDNDGADESGEVGIDALDADLGKDGGQRCECR
jgi:hypothetical protein